MFLRCDRTCRSTACSMLWEVAAVARVATARRSSVGSGGPSGGPLVHREHDREQLLAFGGEVVAGVAALHDARGAQLGEAISQHAGGDLLASLLQIAKRGNRRVP